MLIMSPDPQMSVLMPVYNAKRYIDRAISSILEQTVADFEFVIIDDGSIDGTSHLLERFAKTDKRIRLIRQENTGLTRALNRGLGEARGELVVRMDADDVAHPRRLEIQARFLAQNPDCLAVGASILMIDS